jgi:hypothetical protein
MITRLDAAYVENMDTYVENMDK